MIWGYALVWIPQMMKGDANPLLGKAMFLREAGLVSTGVGVAEIDALAPPLRERLGAYLAEHRLQFTLLPRVDWLHADRGEVERAIDGSLEMLRRWAPLCRATLVHMGVGSYHRFLRDPPLSAQMERLARVLPRLVAGCRELSLRVGIENHGDYYCSDLVGLCRTVPGLGIFLDTGNTYLIGEAPLPAIEQAAPYVVGGHFKDHHVRPRPDGRPLNFEIGGAVLGEGDVPLREAFALLRRLNPAPDRIEMQIEYIPPGDRPFEQGLHQSIAFCRSLEAGA